jgi:hypothetical protein
LRNFYQVAGSLPLEITVAFYFIADISWVADVESWESRSNVYLEDEFAEIGLKLEKTFQLGDNGSSSQFVS